MMKENQRQQSEARENQSLSFLFYVLYAFSYSKALNRTGGLTTSTEVAQSTPRHPCARSKHFKAIQTVQTIDGKR